MANSLTPFCLLTILLGACSGGGSGSQPPPEPSLPVPATLQTQITQIVERTVAAGIPSVALELHEKGKTVSVYRGIQDRNSSATVTADSRYHIASNGKLITALTIMRLVEQGILRLDDAPTDWLPDTKLNALFNGVSLKMLLQHTSGIPDYLSQPGFLKELAANPGRRWTTAEVLSYLQASARQSQPGTQFAYSNTNYLLLGDVIEQATSLTLAQAIRFWVLDELALPNSLHSDEAAAYPALVRGYVDQAEQQLLPGGNEIEANRWTEAHWFADAPLQSTAVDWVSLVQRVFTAGDFLTVDALAQLTAPSSGDTGYGLGVYIGKTPAGETVYFHGGAIWGFNSQFFHVPERQLTLAVFASGEGGDHDDRFVAMIGDLLDVLRLNENS